MKNSNRCSKCGQLLIRNDNYSKFCLDGYKPKPDLCAGCNATESVIKRLNESGDISYEECRILPKTLIFDPKGNNIEEENIGRKFQKLVDRFTEKVNC